MDIQQYFHRSEQRSDNYVPKYATFKAVKFRQLSFIELLNICSIVYLLMY